MARYLEILMNNSSTAPTWLLQNLNKLNADIFEQEALTEMTPLALMTMRACAPSGVFTTEGKAAYLRQVKGFADLEKIADMLFCDDDSFQAALPPEYAAQLRTLMVMAKKLPS